MQRHMITLTLVTLMWTGHALGQSGWVAPSQPLGAVARNAVLLPPVQHGSVYYEDGLVLYFRNTGGSSEGAYLWNPSTGTTLSARTPSPGPNPGGNFFCGGHAFDAFGRVVFGGGQSGQGGNCGIQTLGVYDPHNSPNPGKVGTLIAAPDMYAGRWYPTCLTVANGNVWLIGGKLHVPPDPPGNCLPNTFVEWYTPDPDPGEPGLLTKEDQQIADASTYPKFHLMGGVNAVADMAHAGPGVNPEGRTYWYNTAEPGRGLIDGPLTALTKDNNDIATSRFQSTSVLLPLDLRQNPPVEEVLVISGLASAQNLNTFLTPTCEILRYDSLEEEWVWVFTPTNLNHGRQRADVVLLADGTPSLVGGVGGGSGNQYAFPVFTPEVFINGVWSTLPNHTYPRGYHSVALLLRDGSVWVAGDDNPDAVQPPLDPHPGERVEIYRPWYFDHPRPSIIWPATEPVLIERTGTFPVVYSLPQGREFGYVALIALSSVTHSTNFSQRYVILISEDSQPGIRSVTPPPAAFAPPGPYMMVVVDNLGVPSVAEFVYLDF